MLNEDLHQLQGMMDFGQPLYPDLPTNYKLERKIMQIIQHFDKKASFFVIFRHYS